MNNDDILQLVVCDLAAAAGESHRSATHIKPLQRDYIVARQVYVYLYRFENPLDLCRVEMFSSFLALCPVLTEHAAFCALVHVRNICCAHTASGDGIIGKAYYNVQ